MIASSGLDPKVITGGYADIPGQKVRYVQSSHLRASNLNNSGLKRDYPLSTLVKAVALSLPYDTIIMLPGHIETVSVANGLDVNKLGLFIHGVGGETTRPQIKVGTLTTANVRISAADVTMNNFDLITDIDSLAQVLNITAAGAKLSNFRCEDSASKQALIHVELAVGASYARISGMRSDCETAGAVSAIKISGACDGVEITDCILKGSFSTANIHVTAAATRLAIGRNVLSNLATNVCILAGAVVATGEIFQNFCTLTGATAAPFAAAITVGSATWVLYENYATDAAALTGALIGTAAT